jgi:catechol 2,3-dioxygenase-like lactoylglutathione lyase family enzyme
MFDHVGISASDRGASERFYDVVLGALGIEKTHVDQDLVEWSDFALSPRDPEHPVTRGLHIGFVASSRSLVDSFWHAGTDAGYRSDGRPGLRPQYRDDYYGAFLLDPDGNSVEAVNDGALRQGGVVDHLWIRVRDVDAAKRFYELAGAFAGFRLGLDTPGRTQFAGETGSFSVVAGEPTQAVHVAFPVADNETVDEFHAAMLAAGHPDNGGPGERAVYHPGYYGAFVLDPDGNNVELVNHNR